MSISKIDLEKFLPQIFLFKELSPDEVKLLASQCTIKRLNRNEVIFSQGQIASAFFVVIYGKVGVYKVSATGAEQAIHYHEDYDLVAEAAIFGESSYPASAKSLKESLIVRVPKAAIVELITGNPLISLKIFSGYSKRMREFIDMVEYLSLDDVYQRVRKYLQKKSVNRNGSNIVELSITKKEVASLLGIAPETLSRTFRKMKANGEIEEREHQIILQQSLGE